jgi:ketosteroid isomerase-like protein
MRKVVTSVVLGLVVLSLAACGGSSGDSAAEKEIQRQADLYAIGQIQTTFHRALSEKDIDLMMSVWAPDATFTLGSGQTKTGTAEIRKIWLASTPFQSTARFVPETPSYKTRATANGDRGTLFFECHLFDAKTAEVIALSGADTQVAKIDGRWLITSFVGATGTLSP